MASFDLKGKVAIVTGGGSGINLAITKLLLEAGCSVLVADLRLRPEAEALVARYPHPPPAAGDSQPSAAFRATDVADWGQLAALWWAALAAFGRVNVVVNGAGYLGRGSSFWRPPGINPLAQDDADRSDGTYRMFSVNTVGPIRLAQLAIDYWLENRDVEGNILWVASIGGYMHMFTEPFYSASKAAVVSTVRCLGPLRRIAGIRNAALCPGAVRTAMISTDHAQFSLGDDDPALTPEQCAEVGLRVLTEPQYGEGSIVETQLAERQDGQGWEVSVREVPLELLYPTNMARQTIESAMAEHVRFEGVLREKGMRSED